MIGGASLEIERRRLYVIVDRDYAGDDERWMALMREIAAAARGQSAMLQVRAKGLAPDALAPLAERARSVVPPDVPLLLNGEPTLARRLGYDGVHWPEAAVPRGGASDTGDLLVTAAAHSEQAVRAAEHAGAHAAVFAAVYGPGSKRGSAAGIEALSRACAATDLPVFALGGVTPDRVAACLHAGARGVAVVSGVLGAERPAAAVAGYLEALEAVRA